MIGRLVDLSIRHRAAVFAAVAFLAAAGWWAMRGVPLDALPDLSDPQVILLSRWDRSPGLIEDQVTYPIVTAMLGAPRVKAVRGFSDFGYSFVYVVFEEGTDIYWARSRVLEYLSGVIVRLPQGVKTEMGPDATGLGWVYQYALVDESGKHSPAELRTFQDWYLRYHLKSVPGVAEVAPIGGFGRQFQVNLDPDRLRAFGIPVQRVVEAVRQGNFEGSGRLLEFGGTEYMIRGQGYLRSLADLGEIVLAATPSGTPIRVRDVGRVEEGPDLRRGVADLDGRGDAVSGIVVMRQGQNALDVIDRVKKKLAEVEDGLPTGVKLVPVYDRSDLIRRAVGNLKATLVEVILTVSLVILLFLGHLPSALIPIVTIPLAVLISFIPLRLMGVSANIMSLGGIAIAVGAMVDAGIVVVEQSHKRLEQWEAEGRRGDPRGPVTSAIHQVAGPGFFALLVIAVSFLPVLTLEAQEGRLFRPLAYTKTLVILVAALLAVTLDPALRVTLAWFRDLSFRPAALSRLLNSFLGGKVRAEENHPLSRRLIALYRPAAEWSLRRKWAVLAGALLLMAATVPVAARLGSEFMPPLDEGSLLYMPTTMPGISIGEAQKLLQTTDAVIRSFPEVDRVFGKAGRAETTTDPAPLSMLETVVTLKPRGEWRRVPTWYSWMPEWLKPPFRRITPDTVSPERLVREMDAALRIPGVSNAWTMPIKGRIDMLSTGIRTPVGLKVSGGDLNTIEQIGVEVEGILREVPGARSVFAERTGGGYFLDFAWDREALARLGVSMEEAQGVLQTAIGGENITEMVRGRERYPVNVRYQRDFRSDLGALGKVLVPAGEGRQVPLSQLASIEPVAGPSMIRDEDGLLTGYVTVDLADSDTEGFIREADRLLRERLSLPPGYSVAWSGQHEAMERARRRLGVVVPLTLFLIVGLLWINTRSWVKTSMVLLAVPFSAIGAVWLLWLLGYNMSVGVWVGLIALLGVDAETGVFMLLYLDLAYEQARREGRLRTLPELRQAVLQGAVARLRPKFMTVSVMVIGLLPIMWSDGTGSDVMKRIAAPLLGGILTSFLLELLVYPGLYEAWKWNFELGRGKKT